MSRVSKSGRVELWLDRLNRFGACNQTVAQFCAAESISAPSFYQWKRRLSPVVTSPKRIHKPLKLKRPKTAKPDRTSAFTELAMTPAPWSTASVQLPGDIKIELGSEPDALIRIIQQVLAHSFATTSPDTTHRDEATRC